MSATTARRERRSYGHFCGLGRALDQVGDRWAMLIVRELLGGPRRYTELHADLPGASTDMLAARLRDLEGDGIVVRRRLASPASGSAYALSERGRALATALTELAAWGAEDLHERRRTDAARVHWHALPLRAVLRRDGLRGTVDVVTDEGRFHVHLDDPAEPGADPLFGDGAADPPAAATLSVEATTLVALCRGERTPGEVGFAGSATTVRRPDSVPPLVAEDHRCDGCASDYATTTVDGARAMLVDGARRARELVGTVADPAWRIPGPDGSWSAAEYLCHVRDVVAVGALRLHRARTEDDPGLEPMLNDVRARRFGYRDAPLTPVVDQLADHVDGLLAELDRVGDGGWDRVVHRYPEERRTVRWLARQAAHEVRHHLADITVRLGAGPR